MLFHRRFVTKHIKRKTSKKNCLKMCIFCSASSEKANSSQNCDSQIKACLPLVHIINMMKNILKSNAS